MTLGAEGNWIRIVLKKKVNREVPFILFHVVVSDNQILVTEESMVSMVLSMDFFPGGVLAESVVFLIFS